MKITRFELLRGRFTYRDQASRRELKIMQNYSKMQHKSPRNEHEKTSIPIAQCSKTHAVDRPAKLHQNAFAFVVTGVALRTPWMQKSLKIIENLPLNNHKNTNAGVAMVRKALCRSTCEHASKRVDFCRSRCCFAHAMDAKFVQNRRKSSMATCNLSTVVPAARRANSKCIQIQKYFLKMVRCEQNVHI